ncbi:MAG TPA: cell division protein FtsQ/DivIB [Solirubrobacterales bacterium]|nr:cell division protein FtsQ/DivIB [Solirubrobacterales bacterium]
MAAVALVAVLGVAGYELLLGNESVAPQVQRLEATARIGSGEDAVAVAADGTPMTLVKVGQDTDLPALPLEELPKNERLAGPVLQQALVLGAAPPALRPLIERSFYGEEGVNVILDAGIELRFGDATQAERKWRAAAAVLADPAISALDYVDLHAPSRPAAYGEGHELPALP